MARHGHVQHPRWFVAGAAFLIATLVLPSTAFQPDGAAGAIFTVGHVGGADAAPGEFTLRVSLAGSSTAGTVTSVPTGIDCGIVCSHAFPDGAVVTLTPSFSAAPMRTALPSSAGAATPTAPTARSS